MFFFISNSIALPCLATTEKLCIGCCCGLDCGREELSLELLAGDRDANLMLGGVVGIGEGRWPEVQTLGMGAEDVSRKPPLVSTLGGNSVREGAHARGLNS